MKLHLMSDLHLEHMKDAGTKFLSRLDPGDADALVLAGDILSLAWLSAGRVLQRFVDAYKRVFYLPGNHEFYNTDPDEATRGLRHLAAGIPGFTVLDQSQEPVEFMGRRFLGCTLWFPQQWDDMMYREQLTDFDLIKHAVPWCYEQHNAGLEHLKRHMREGDIVVTHHAPHPGSIHRRFKGHSINRFFACDLEPLILERKPLLWMHGHMHDPFDYKVGDTRIVCNPKGYPSERSVIYKPLLIEVPP